MTTDNDTLNGYLYEKDDEDKDVDEDDLPRYNIVSKVFWDQHHYFDDSHISDELEPFLPKGFFECMECCFEFEGTSEDAEHLLDKAGFRKIVR